MVCITGVSRVRGGHTTRGIPTMTERSLTRRESLFGIGAASTALGGGALVSNAFAGEEQDGKDETTDGKKGGLRLEFVCHEKTRAKFRVHNERADGAKVSWKVDADREALENDLNVDLDDLDEDDIDDDDLDDIEDGLDDDDIDDVLDDIEGLRGKLTVPKGGSKTFRARVVPKYAAVDLYHGGKKVDTADVSKRKCEKAGKSDGIDLEAVCHRTRKVEFDDLDGADFDNAFAPDVTDVDEDFDPDGETIVNGQEVDDDDLDDFDDVDGIDDTDDLEGLDGTAKVREAKFRVHNWNDEAVKVNWHVNGGDQGGKLSLEGRDSAHFWVTLLDDQKTSVSVTVDGDVVDAEKADTDAGCADVHGD